MIWPRYFIHYVTTSQKHYNYMYTFRKPSPSIDLVLLTRIITEPSLVCRPISNTMAHLRWSAIGYTPMLQTLPRQRSINHRPWNQSWNVVCNNTFTVCHSSTNSIHYWLVLINNQCLEFSQTFIHIIYNGTCVLSALWLNDDYNKLLQLCNREWLKKEQKTVTIVK